MDSIVIIVLLNQEEEINDFIHTIDQACNIAHRILEIHTMAGIGKVRKSIQNLHHSYIEANAALDYKLLVKPNQAIYIHDMEPLSETRFIIDEIDIQQIIKAIKVGTMEELEETVINIVQQMTAQGVSLLQLQNSMMEVFVELLRLARVYELEAAELEGLNKSFITLMQQVHSQESVVEWLLQPSLWSVSVVVSIQSKEHL